MPPSGNSEKLMSHPPSAATGGLNPPANIARNITAHRALEACAPPQCFLILDATLLYLWAMVHLEGVYTNG